MFVDSEMEAFVEYLLLLDFVFAPNESDTSEPAAIKSKNEILRFVASTEEKQWHLIHDSFSKFELDMRAIKEGRNKGKFFVMPRNGGPTIDLSWSGVRELKGKRFVREGSVSHYPTFWNPVTEENDRAPEAQRNAYKEIVKWIKAHCVPSENPVDPNGRQWPPVWIGKEAAKAWAEGLHLGPPSNESRRPRIPMS